MARATIRGSRRRGRSSGAGRLLPGRLCLSTRGGVESQSSPQIAGLYQSVFDMFDLRASVGLAGQLEERARNDFESRARRLTSGTCNDVILDSRYVSKSA